MNHRAHTRLLRLYLTILAGAATVALMGAVFAATLAGTSVAATAVAPTPTSQPAITGTPRVGEVLRTTRGTWTGTEPITYAFRWYRCQGRGAPDASDCRRISNASNASYTLRQADAGFRIRSQVVATNADGSARATSNPTNAIQSARPTNTTAPSISGTAVVGNRLTANRGEWVGNTPITYSFQWLRCNASGAECSEISRATDNTYLLVEADLNRTIRVRVTARNDAGRRSAISNPTAQVRSAAQPPPPTGSIPVGNLQVAGDRLTISQVVFAPNPVTSRTAPITVRIRITARQGRPVSGALVFMRATPRVVQGQTATTQPDGWVTLRLVPNRAFPQPRSGFNVQFFIRAYRANDPPLGGIAGYRLVQVRLAG
ncbi:MAG TPA: hypothetical protein VK926_01305 [Gaiellaceae bacterium]|nr:hypothetical protein [Gaiellaceae bacterium]